MRELELIKKFMSGIFDMNYQICEIDDAIFLQMVRSGIENAADDDKEIYYDLIAHATDLYISEWLRMASEDETDPDLEYEKAKARKTIMNYFDGGV